MTAQTSTAQPILTILAIVTGPRYVADILQGEDDTAIIASRLSYIPATNGNSLATATPLATVVFGITATSTGAGVVTQPGVANFFSFSAPVPATATITGQVHTLISSASKLAGNSAKVLFAQGGHMYAWCACCCHNVTHKNYNYNSTRTTLSCCGSCQGLDYDGPAACV
jgi:hypothetical protein